MAKIIIKSLVRGLYASTVFVLGVWFFVPTASVLKLAAYSIIFPMMFVAEALFLQRNKRGGATKP